MDLSLICNFVLQKYAHHFYLFFLGLKQMRASLRQVDCIVEIHDARISFLLQREWLLWMIKPWIFKTFFNWSTYHFLEEIPHFKRVLMSGHTYLYWTRWIWRTRQKSRSYNLLHFIIASVNLSKCKSWEYLNGVLIKNGFNRFFFISTRVFWSSLTEKVWGMFYLQTV